MSKVNPLLRLLSPLNRTEPWWRRAACRTADPVLFDERDMSGPVKYAPADLKRTAEQYCGVCPVLAQCRAEADEHPTLTGLFGGRYRTYGKTKRNYREFELLADDTTCRTVAV